LCGFDLVFYRARFYNKTNTSHQKQKVIIMPQELAPSQPLFDSGALKRLIIPLVIEQFLLMTVGMADTLMVNTAGQAAVSGVSLVDSLNLLLIQVFAALSTGGAVVVSQYLGRREQENARTAAKQLLYSVTAAACLLTLFALVFRQHLLTFLFGSIEDDIMDSALDYFIATALAYPFISVYNAGAALFRSMGNSKVSMFNSFLVNLVNITVNAILIYGFQMGALGAGIGTLVSRIVAAVSILLLLRQSGNPLCLAGLFHVSLRWDMIRRILTIGIPNGLENGLFQAGKLIVLSLITTLGSDAVAANAIANSVAGILNVPGQAIGLAMITVVGQCMGARDPEQAVRYVKKLMTITYLSIGVLAVGLFLGAGTVTSLFNMTPEAIAIGTQVLRCCSVATSLFWPSAFCLPNALRASGDAMFTMVVSMSSMFLFRVIFSYLLAPAWGLGLGLLGVWLAMFLDWVFRSAIFLTRFLRGKWKTMRLIGA